MGEFEKQRSAVSSWGQHLNLTTWNPINTGRDAWFSEESGHQLWGQTSSPKETRRKLQLHPKGLLPLGTSYKWKYKGLNGSLLLLLITTGLDGRMARVHGPLSQDTSQGQHGKLCPQVKASLLPVSYAGFTFFNGWKIPNENNILWCENYVKFQFLCR